MPVSEERAARAIAQACNALKRRKAVEEGAHSSVIDALNEALAYQGAELQEKVESLQQEIAQCYKTQAHVSEQLVHEMQTSLTLKAQLAEKETAISQVQEELDSARTRIEQLEKDLAGKESAVCILVEELNQFRSRVKELEASLSKLEAENKQMVDRLLTEKMVMADRLNEVNAMYADAMERYNMNSLAQLAKQQVDGIVRHSEAGAEGYMRYGPPTTVRHTLRAHDRGCTSIMYEHATENLYTAGHDNVVKFWDTTRGSSTNVLTGALSSIIDLSLSGDNCMVLGACSDHKLYLWDVRTGRIKHVLTGHSDKVSSVDISKVGNKRAASTAYDRTIKTWDLQRGFQVNTMMCGSSCNSLCLSIDGTVICSGHTDGTLRFWDVRAGKLSNELTAHEPQAITSVTLSRSGQTVLTNGKDNVLKMFDVRTLELKATFRAPGYTVATNFSRSCMSGNEEYVAAGSGNGRVYVWKKATSEVESLLEGGHGVAVVACAWSEIGKSLASADKNGTVCIWE